MFHPKFPSLGSGIVIGGLAAVLLLPGCGKQDAPKSGSSAKAPSGLTSDEQKVSYGIGFNMASDLAHGAPFKVDQEAFRAGIADGLAGGKMKIERADLEKAFQAIQANAEKAASAAAEKNIAEGTAFLAKNKTKAGVKTTASGLQYEVVKGGNGPKPKPTDTVVVSYHGTLIDGSVFDSSVERGDTAEFRLDQVIPGWTEGLQLMSVGDKYKFYVPANLGYGARARGNKIPANSVLIFEVELKQIK